MLYKRTDSPLTSSLLDLIHTASKASTKDRESLIVMRRGEQDAQIWLEETR